MAGGVLFRNVLSSPLLALNRLFPGILWLVHFTNLFWNYPISAHFGFETNDHLQYISVQNFLVT